METFDIKDWIVPGLQKGQYRAQIQQFIIEKIRSGALKPNDSLPSYRWFGNVNGVNRNTLMYVYNKLYDLAWVTRKIGTGTYVSPVYPGHERLYPESRSVTALPIKLPKPADLNVHTSDFSQNFTAIGFDMPNPCHYPMELYKNYMQFYARRYKTITQMQQVTDLQGHDLKDAVLSHVNNKRSFGLNSGCLAVGLGRGQVLKQVIRTLVQPGELVINTSAQDRELHEILAASGAKTVSLSMLDEDFIPRLREILAVSRIKALYVRPQCSYPESYTMSDATCMELLELAKEFGFYIIEEDDYHEFWYEQSWKFEPLVCRDHQGHVIYLGALSLVSPYLRHIRIVAAAAEFITLLRLQPAESFGYRNILEEKSIVDMLRNGDLNERSRTAQTIKRNDLFEVYTEMYNYLSDVASVTRPLSGLSLYIKFQSDESLKGYMDHLEEQGFRIPYMPDSARPGPGIVNIRLGYGTWDIKEAQDPAKVIQERYRSQGR